MTFDLEWNGQSIGDDADRDRAIAAAATFCGLHDIDPAEAWAENLACIEHRGAMDDTWSSIEWAALEALAVNWNDVPDNVALVWK